MSERASLLDLIQLKRAGGREKPRGRGKGVGGKSYDLSWKAR